MRRLLTILVLVVILPMLVIQVVAYSSWYRARVASTLQRDTEIARATAVIFGAYVRDIVRQQLAIGEAIVRLEPEAVQQYLEANVSSYEAIDAVYWTTPDLRVIASTDAQLIGTDLHDREFLKQIGEGAEWAISDVTPSRSTDQPIVLIACAIRDGVNQLLGLVVARVQPHRLGEAVIPLYRGNGPELQILDQQGQLVYRSGTTVMTWDEVRRKRVLNDMFLVQALRGQESAGEVLSSQTGRRMLTGNAPVPEIGWVARVVTVKHAALAPIYRSLLLGVALLLAGALFAALFAYLINRKILSGIRRLQAQARAIERGAVAPPREYGITELRQLGEALHQAADRRYGAEAQLRRTAEELERALQAERDGKAELQKAIGELETFSYSVSHDLKAPLRAIDAYAAFLAEEGASSFSEEARRYCTIIRQNIQQMAKLIDDMLRLARVGRAPLARAEVNTRELLRQVLDELKPRRDDQSVECEIADLPGLLGDESMLRQVFANLIGNALKYARPDVPLRIEVGVEEQDSGPVFFVRDNGSGFNMKHIDQLFRPFQRLHNDPGIEGTGIGLAIVERIITRHGGQVWAESEPGRGTTFFLRLPCRESEDGAGERTRTSTTCVTGS
jgi:signal transduction histidine kinase